MEATLAAVNRTGKGKNEARRLRASGQVPAVVYGAQKAGDAIAPVQIAVSPKEMMRILHSASGVNTLITLNGPGDSTQKVLVREFQLDPVTSALLHADFYRVNLEKKIAVKVPVVLHGEPKGVKTQGGILEFLNKEVEVECLPTAIPEHIDLDVSGLLRREMTMDEAGDRLIEIMLRTCNGRLTCAEALGHREPPRTRRGILR